MSGRFPVFLDWTNAKQRIKCLAEGHSTVSSVSLKLVLLRSYCWALRNGVARTLKQLHISKGNYCIKHWFSTTMSLFKLRGSEFFPLRAVPCGMGNHFYHNMWAPLSVIFSIAHVHLLRNGSYANAALLQINFSRIKHSFLVLLDL